MLGFKTASTIATSIAHQTQITATSSFSISTQIQRLQLIQNSLPRVVTRTTWHHHIIPILKSLYWLKIPESIHFKVLSLNYNSLQSSQPTYPRELREEFLISSFLDSTTVIAKTSSSFDSSIHHPGLFTQN